jgi:hypothetical protein
MISIGRRNESGLFSPGHPLMEKRVAKTSDPETGNRSRFP